jgi:hypothetical protein
VPKTRSTDRSSLVATNRSELIDALARAAPSPEGVVYLERRGQDYRWELLEAQPSLFARADGEAPDAWLYRSGPWPVGGPEELAAFAEDLVEEMEAMAGGTDRCRWPLDDPWFHRP